MMGLVEESINSEEAQDHTKFMEKLLNCKTSKERESILIDALVLFGHRFGYSLKYCKDHSINNKEFFEEVSNKYFEILLEWLNGKKMTERADESERRAYYGSKLISGDKLLGLFRVAANAILHLPENHELRDVSLARQALLKYIDYVRANRDIDGQVSAIHDILKYKVESKNNSLKLIQEGQELLKSVSDLDIRRNFQFATIGYFVELAIDERDNGNTDSQHTWGQEAEKIFNQMRTENLGSWISEPANLNIQALLYEIMEKYSEAANTYTKVVETRREADEVFCRACKNLGRLSINLGQYDQAIQAFAPLVPIFENRYLSAVVDTEIISTGKDFSEVMKGLTFAHASLGHWNDAVKSLEKSKSLRLRYQAALRKSPDGRNLLKMEMALYALSRGVDVESTSFNIDNSSDWLGKRVSLHSKVLEEYRVLRPKLPEQLLEVSSISEISSGLASDEALVVLGLGIFMVVILNGDKEVPSGHFLLNEWPLKRLVPIFAGEQEDGWLFLLGAPEAKVDGKKALKRLIDGIDEAIGKNLRSFLESKNIHKVTIIPHSWLHLVPFWSLPSLIEFEVSTSPSLTHFTISRQSVDLDNQKALVVADPTLDLPLSSVEANSIIDNLSKSSILVEYIRRENAREDIITKKLDDASIFHFCGHGLSDLIKPIRSSLMLYPNKNRFPDDDPFAKLIASAQNWKITDPDENERCSDLKDSPGRICEREIPFPEGKKIERRFEYSETGTLWGLYAEDQRPKLAELWTVGDIMVEEHLKNCKLAFLSACESGKSELSADIDEYSGLPAALQLAGVSTVISTMWPLSDVLTILYVDLFYDYLITSTQPVNIAAIIRNVSNRLRNMRREEVASLLNDLRKRTSDKYVRGLLKAHAYNFLKEEDEFPFSHPYEWAALYAVGANSINFSK